MQLPKLENKKKINWKKGSAELIGFTLVLPMMCLILFSIVTLMQTGILRQSLEYATYMGARAAVVCEDPNTARTSATQAVVSSLTGEHSVGGFDADDIIITMNLVGGTSDIHGPGIAWEKGALLEFTVTVPYEALYQNEMKTMSSSLFVMVEQPAKTY